MVLQDLLIGPFYFLIILGFGYVLRPYFTNVATRKYFMPALLARLIGAIVLGAVYQFHYRGGDTFSFWSHGSRWIWEAFIDNPLNGLSLIFGPSGMQDGVLYPYYSHIWYYYDAPSYFIVRIAGFFDLFTFHTYAATALLFGAVGFSGSWAFYSVIVKKYGNRRFLALGLLFMPSVVLWGSGLMKDTITLAALGWLTWSIYHIAEQGKLSPLYWLLAAISIWLILSIKVYILICFVPLLFIWFAWGRIQRLTNPVLKLLAAPVVLSIFALVGYSALLRIAETNPQYALDNIAEKAAITSYDIREGWGARNGGDGAYFLGNLDGSFGSMVSLFPQAVVVSLFRPFLWEVGNPFMLLAALEALLLFGFSFWFLIFKGNFRNVYRDPFLLFCFLFAIVFAFAVGVSTSNFGTLMRYKIPMLPFYWTVLVVSLRKS